MKLRFHDNSLRLRLSQSEMARLKESGRVENSVSFAPGRVLVYSLEAREVGQVGATFEDGRLRVLLPENVARHWIDSDETGVEGGGESLKILVEKDFKCLHRSGEEDLDAFPNPLED